MKGRFLRILCCFLFLEIAFSFVYYTYDLGVDDDFNSYVVEYDYLYKTVCKADSATRKEYLLSIKYYDELEVDGTIGYCEYLPFKNKIRFNKRWWESASVLEKRQLVYHELTHCYLGISHSFDSNNYMYPFIHNMRDYILVEQTKETLDRICNYGI